MACRPPYSPAECRSRGRRPSAENGEVAGRPARIPHLRKGVDEAGKMQLKRSTWIPGLDTNSNIPYIPSFFVGALLPYGILLVDHADHGLEGCLGTCNGEESKLVEYIVQSAINCQTIRRLQNEWVAWPTHEEQGWRRHWGWILYRQFQGNWESIPSSSSLSLSLETRDESIPPRIFYVYHCAQRWPNGLFYENTRSVWWWSKVRLGSSSSFRPLLWCSPRNLTRQLRPYQQNEHSPNRRGPVRVSHKPWCRGL